MITQEILIAVALADIDALAHRPAIDMCLLRYTDAGGETWTCSRRKGHPDHLHVDTSLPLPDARWGRYNFHRWIGDGEVLISGQLLAEVERRSP